MPRRAFGLVEPAWYPQESNLGLSGFNRALGPLQLGHRAFAGGESAGVAEQLPSNPWDCRGPGGIRTLILRLAKPMLVLFSYRPSVAAGSAELSPLQFPSETAAQSARSGGRIRTSNLLLNRELPNRLGPAGMGAVGRIQTPILEFEARDAVRCTTTAWYRVEESNLDRRRDAGFTDRPAPRARPGRWQLDRDSNPVLEVEGLPSYPSTIEPGSSCGIANLFENGSRDDRSRTCGPRLPKPARWPLRYIPFGAESGSRTRSCCLLDSCSSS